MNHLSKISGITPDKPDKNKLLLTHVQDLPFSVRALNCLNTANISTMGDLIKYAPYDLLKFRNFGKKSIIELKEIVRSYGLKFKNEP